MQGQPRRWVFAASLAVWAGLIGPALGQTAPNAPAAVPGRETELEERLRKMEAMNQKLADRFEAVARQNEALGEQLKTVADQNKALSKKVEILTDRVANGTEIPPPGVGATAPGGPVGMDNAPAPAQASPRVAADEQPPDLLTDEPEPKSKQKATRSFFDEGFKWETRDGEYTLNFHNETQLDIRAYQQASSNPTDQTGFFIPRMRLYFNGRLTKPIQYSVSINKGIGALDPGQSAIDLLDAYLNFNYDPRFQLRVGRFRAPFTYEWYAMGNQVLTTPERSLFANNYGYNRDFAVMGHGELFRESLEYAVAGANGPRNGYFSTNSHKDLLAYLNVRPFMNVEELPALQHLNLGGSMAYGIEGQSALPLTFRTTQGATESPGADYASTTFLKLHDGVTETGVRELWELNAAYFYKGLTVIAAWETGFNTYGQTTGPSEVRVPVSAYHVATSYFITGEQIERRTFVEPLHPFDLRKGKFGTGAIELQARFDTFALGHQVFTGGLADPNLWTSNLYAIDSGANWYLNKYMKIYFDWSHAVFGNPVEYRPGGLQKTSDLFWLRFQVYF